MPIPQKHKNRINPFRAGLNKLKKFWRQWKDFRAVAAKFYPYIRKNRNALAISQALGIGYMLTGMLEPWPIKLIFDSVFLNNPLPAILAGLPGAAENDRVLLLVILISSVVVLAFIRGIFYYFQQLLTSRSGQRISSGLRADLYSHIQNLSFSFHDRRRIGDLISRLTTDIRVLRQMLISLPITITSELFMMAGMIIIIFLMNWQLSLLVLLIIPIIAMLLKNYQQPMKQAIRKEREREGHLTSIAAEVFNAIKVVQGFHQEKYEVSRFKAQNKSSLRSGLKAARLEAKLKWSSELAVAVVTAMVLGAAAHMVLSGALLPGDVLVFVAYVKNFNRPIRRVSRFSEQSARASASGERILHMLNIKPEITDRPGAVKAKRIKGNIEYKNVCFHYRNGPDVLHDITFQVKPGQKIAVIGHTGCGKSTLASLLTRFYDVAQGSVLIDGIDVRDYTVASLRENITLVFQEPVLFAATISENIAYGKPGATADEIVASARKAKIHPIIESLENGYDTLIGERGGTLSGGQRQCIAITRAMIKDAPIVVLDEPTAGLDDTSAALVLDALRELMAGRTVIMITHQLKTVQDADQVIVMKDGRIIRQGSPSEVLPGICDLPELHYMDTGRKIDAVL
jgi:ATP-binding cassette subfamily B protein